MSLLRVLIFHNGQAKANFSDNTVIVLDASGAAFTAITSSGQKVHQRCEFAVKQFAEKVGTVLDFRNRHIDQPYFAAILPLQERRLTQSCLLERRAHWPVSEAEAKEEGCLESRPDGSLALSCLEKTASILLPSHAAHFQATYPLLIGSQDKPRRYEYAWQTQVFSTSDCPPRWKPAVTLALQLTRTATTTGLFASGKPSEVGQGPFPRPYTDLPESDHTPEATWEAHPAKSWWYSCSVTTYPTRGVLPKLEWLPSATFRYLAAVGEAEVVLAADGSVLRTTHGGAFFKHMQARGEEKEAVYAAAGVPHVRATPAGEIRLKDIADRALQFLAAARSLEKSVQHAEQVAASAKVLPPFSAVVKEQCRVEGSGSFTAYKDGRVRVLYVDRTILEMDSAQEHCRVTLPSGMQLEVRVDVPTGVEKYVRAAKEFAQWAYRSPAERAGALEQEAAIQAEVQRLSRYMHLCNTTIASSNSSVYRRSNEALQPSAGFGRGKSDLVAVDREALVQAMLDANRRQLQAFRRSAIL